MGISLNNVTVDYPLATSEGSLRALDNMSLEVAPGESVAIIGPSGCGKSTTLRLISGLMKPTSGEVKINNEIVEGPRQKTALILQDFGLLPWKTVYQNAELGLKLHKVNAKERKEKTLAALERVGLQDFAKRYPSELSGGMKQRLALARAIATDVDIFLMDEPLSALDALLREELQNTLFELWIANKYSQVLVTHSIEEAVLLGQRIVVMAPRPGRIIAEIPNPEMTSLEYRSDALFFERCSQVRAALAEGGAR